jgi:hypothetical protein
VTRRQKVSACFAPPALTRRAVPGRVRLAFGCLFTLGLTCALLAEPAPPASADPNVGAGLDGAVYRAPAHPDYFAVPLYVRLELRGGRLHGHARPVARPGAPEQEILTDFIEERGEYVLGRLYAPTRERSFRARIWQREGRLLVRIYDDYNYRTLEFSRAP